MRRRGRPSDGPAVRRALSELGWDGCEVLFVEGFRCRLTGFICLSPTSERGAPRVLVFAHCGSLHTCFMQFALDIAFADERGRVLAAYEAVPPWRALTCAGAAFAMERPSLRAP